MQNLYAQLGREIAGARKDLGWTQQTLADKVGLSRASIANIELGRQKMLVHTFVQLCRALDIPAGTILGLRSAAPAPVQRKRTAREIVARLDADLQAHAAHERERLRL